MSSEKKILPIINNSKPKPLTANKSSINCDDSIKINNSLSNKKIKKLNITSRSISLKKTNISNESDKLKNSFSKNMKNILVKSSYRIKGNFLLYKKMFNLSSSEEKKI